MRFILAVIADTLKVRNVKRAQVLQQLKTQGFAALPKHDGKGAGGKGAGSSSEEKGDDDSESGDEEADGDSGEDEDEEKKTSAGAGGGKGGYDYLLSMPLWSLTQEKVAALKAEKEAKEARLQELAATPAKQLWRADLLAFEAALKEHEALEAAQDKEGAVGPLAKGTRTRTNTREGRQAHRQARSRARRHIGIHIADDTLI